MSTRKSMVDVGSHRVLGVAGLNPAVPTSRSKILAKLQGEPPRHGLRAWCCSVPIVCLTSHRVGAGGRALRYDLDYMPPSTELPKHNEYGDAETPLLA